MILTFDYDYVAAEYKKIIIGIDWYLFLSVVLLYFFFMVLHVLSVMDPRSTVKEYQNNRKFHLMCMTQLLSY